MKAWFYQNFRETIIVIAEYKETAVALIFDQVETLYKDDIKTRIRCLGEVQPDSVLLHQI